MKPPAITVLDLSGKARSLPKPHTVKAMCEDASAIAGSLPEDYSELRDEMYEHSRSGDPSGRTGISDPTASVVLRHEEMGEHLSEATRLAQSAVKHLHEARAAFRGARKLLNRADRARGGGTPPRDEMQPDLAGSLVPQAELARLREAKARRDGDA